MLNANDSRHYSTKFEIGSVALDGARGFACLVRRVVAATRITFHSAHNGRQVMSAGGFPSAVLNLVPSRGWYLDNERRLPGLVARAYLSYSQSTNCTSWIEMAAQSGPKVDLRSSSRTWLWSSLISSMNHSSTADSAGAKMPKKVDASSGIVRASAHPN